MKGRFYDRTGSNTKMQRNICKGRIIKMYDVEQMIITDGPRYIGIVPVKKFLESIENTITE